MSKTFGCRHRLSLRQVRVITEHPISSKVQDQECVPHVPKVLSHFHNHMANKRSQLRAQSQFLPSNDSDRCGGNTRERQLSSRPHNQSHVSNLHIAVGRAHNRTFTVGTPVASPAYHTPSKQCSEAEAVNKDTGG